ncbi:A/G-specific adenine glycosylase [Candidatus Woesearchaeota archaeon]|nr:A/G-specific adenine glycosylase [Candidatus Woesearchaeota archaeon]
MNIASFRRKVLSWYRVHGRDLPWRKTTDPYAIMVSEIMLQQTQVDRVIPKYHAFLAAFPDVRSLAQASTEELLREWSGLGYNNRALRLRETARVLVVLKTFPNTEEGLLQLPGIGPYTSRSILAFAFNMDVPVIDTNIRRIFIHEFGLSEAISQKELEAFAKQVLPKGKACIWYNALMDYGALHLTSRRTGIRPTSRQPSFEGSTRQVRGQILRHLISHGKTDVNSLRLRYPHPEFSDIVDKMIRDNLLVKEKDVLYFSE